MRHPPGRRIQPSQIRLGSGILGVGGIVTPTQEQTLERITDGLAAFNRGDLDGMLAPIHPEIRFEPLRAVLDGTVYEGHEGFRRWLGDMAEDWEDFTIELGQIRPLGEDRLLVEARLRARARTSGVEMEGPAVWLCDLRDGLVARLRFYKDADAALEAAGGSGAGP
jgi:ketosteroid isomerase-like protein